MHAGRTTPNGGVYIQMGHLGLDKVREQFKGMVVRCADYGFDMAGGLVEVVPTTHYMMGGVIFRPDCTTALHGLFAAGEDTGGVHGANRLGGNGVANSTVFGGIVGESMAAWLCESDGLREPDMVAIDASIAAHRAPFGQPVGNLQALYECVWEDVGILRTEAELRLGIATLARLKAELATIGVADGDPTFNMTWHEWVNLRRLPAVSRAIATAALAREDSRGAHFGEDAPQISALATSAYTVVRQEGAEFGVTTQAVWFVRVRPGEALLVAVVVAGACRGVAPAADRFHYFYLPVPGRDTNHR